MRVASPAGGVRRTGLDLYGPSNLRVTSATHSE